ncbi:MAG: dTMP kinase [Nitrosomonadaceae bacterium]|nr:dTMP kinase [Nitrosomonadaceae bacterium]|tara:strand:- start:452 stop:1081 length:630 start_codon:yes stop_codon:yes gene_type:complete
MLPGKFITLEGIDGAGKSTHLSWLETLLSGMGKKVQLTHEPGGTNLGEELRKILLDSSQAIHPETEALLMFAARKEHLDKLILPSLAKGNWVISDRFTDASFAYQGGGRGIHEDRLKDLEYWVQNTFQPDLTFYFDVTSELGRKRINARGNGVEVVDRFEKEKDEFFNRVRESYLKRARRFSNRIHIIDASEPVEDIRLRLKNIVLTIC